MTVMRTGASCWKIMSLWVCLVFVSGGLPDRGEASQPYTPSSPDPVLESWCWRSFPELKGLGLRCMAEDKDGNMWFGVDDGVRRYDGVNWTAYTSEDGLLGAQVLTLCTTQDGRLYAGTYLGISRFSAGGWSRVFPPEGDLPWYVWDLMEASDGSLWAGTRWGALRLSPEGPTLYTTEEMAAALRVLAPHIPRAIVPDEVAPARSWPKGIGALAASMSRRGPILIVWLAPGGPGEASGLKVGDRIIAVDGQSNVTLRRLRGPVDTSMRLTVEREGHPEPFEMRVTREGIEGTFRQDLYFRLARFTVHVPPLRDRKEDVPLLAQHFLDLLAREMSRQPPGLSPEALRVLTAYDFPGNVRELRNLMERALLESRGAEIQPEHLHLLLPRPARADERADMEWPDFERDELEQIKDALKQTKGNVTAAARLLGVNRSRIYRLMHKHHLMAGS